MQLLLVCGFCFSSVMLASMVAYPTVMERVSEHIRRKSAEAAEQLGDMFLNLSYQVIWLCYALAPVVIGLVAWLLTERWIFGVVGVALGPVMPRLVIAWANRMRRKKFHSQLVDSLLLMSSSLKAGLSMLQAFTVVAEEMPAPVSQEFGLALKEIRMGVNMDEAMIHMRERMPSDDTTLLVAALLVARETGGDITHIFSRLVETLRERKKIREKIKTLTFMARMQGLLMAMLPVVFGYLVFKISPDNVTFFIKDPLGRIMGLMVLTLEGIGFVLFLRFGRSPL